jgi:DNA-directed RNA polymerase subunit RPC12/RpoP
MTTYVCAECGTTTATTYVVTTLDTAAPKDTRTEVCRPCDDALRTAHLDPSRVAYRGGMLTDIMVSDPAIDPGYRVKLTSATGETHWMSLEPSEVAALARVLTGGDA